MGWSSATSIFDGAVDVALAHASKLFNIDTHEHYVPDALKKQIVYDMYTCVDWDDWDTQDESKYFHPYLLEIMHDLGEIDEESYEDLTTYEH